MKKFQFSLDTVLDYKNQVLDSATAEYGNAAAAVNRQERTIREIKQSYENFNMDYRRRQAEGMTVAEALVAQNSLRSQEKEIQSESERLQKLMRRAEDKRLKMVDAKKDTSTIEKLREKKLDSYNKEVQKDQEKLIDEFISASRSAVTAGM